MAQYEETEKRPGGCLLPMIVLLIILLLLGGTIGYLYYSVVKAPLELDDPQKMAASAPMSPEERFTFSADGTVQVRVDKADLWSVILAHAGNDFLDIINQEISAYGLSVSGCAIHLDEEGVRLDLEVYYKQTRLVDAENGFIRKTSSLYRMVDAYQQYTREVDMNKTYILGLVFRGVNGEPFLMYEKEIQENNTYYREIVLHSLTEEEAAQLQVPDKFGVWTD